MTDPRLLLVEDDPNDAMFFKMAIADVPITLAHVTDGDAAVEWLTQWVHAHPAWPRSDLVVVLDLKLPRRSGLEVLGWMRAHPVLRATPVIILTSSPEPTDRARCEALGAEAYHVKPVHFPTYVGIVHAIGRRCLEAVAG